VKKYPAAFLFILCGALLASCAMYGRQQPELIPLPNKPERVAYPGFSVVPPQGGGWFLAHSQDPRVSMFLGSYLKKGSTAGHTISATVWSHWLPSSAQGQFGIDQLLDGLRKKTERENTGRFKYLSEKSSRLNFHGAECVRSDLDAEDRGVPHDEGVPYHFTIHMIMCIHPKAPLYLIQLEYSQRTPPGVQPINIEPVGEAFFDSLVFDPIGARVTTFEVGKAPSGIAVAQGLIWVANQTGGTVSVINPAKNKTVETVSLGSYATPTDITGNGTTVWVADHSKDCVIRIDAKTRRFVANIPADKGPVGVTYGFDYIWVVNSGDGLVSRIEPYSSSKKSVDVGGVPTSVSIGTDTVWVGLQQLSQMKQFLTNAGRNPIFLPLLMTGDMMDPYKGSLVSRINPKNMEVLFNIPVGKGPLALLARNDAIWVASFAEDSVYRIDPTNNKIVATIKVGRGPTALAFYDGLVWVANAYDDDVLRIDPATNMVVGHTIPVNARPVAMVSDGHSLWVANFGDDTVLRLDPDSVAASAK